ncbi:hypothetical protein Hypma_009989 [Hypsizygus marmoreus]|uniref:Survival motor neuron interacting protein 1 n=1 Tax=Hypsizygus marmoreus TaxID=39966 RepID=A0A369JMG3_HYPMA|nr:hypothetical protein Hypma_009989 [Hypsizygus marmoreus]
MAPYKRKRDDRDDSDDEEPAFGRQILPVANLPEDFDAPPADGLQYLFTVRRDARYLPHVTRVANPYEIASPQPSRSDTRTIPSHINLPSEEWRSIYEARFRNFRRNVNQPTIGVPFIPQNGHRRLIPDKKERDSWWAYLAGKPESDWNPSKHSKKSLTPTQRRLSGQAMRGFADENDAASERRRQESWQTNDEGEVEQVLRVDPSESLPTPTGSPAPPESGEAGPSSVTLVAQEIMALKPREPLPSLLRHIDQRMALHLLMYFAYWINVYLQHPDPASQPLETHARWIFALLTKVEDQISADDMSLLRNLARACLAFLKKQIQTQPPFVKAEEPDTPCQQDKDKNSMSVRSCWIVFSTIAGVWAQHDLWMDAEDMLNALQPQC